MVFEGLTEKPQQIQYTKKDMILKKSQHPSVKIPVTFLMMTPYNAKSIVKTITNNTTIEIVKKDKVIKEKELLEYSNQSTISKEIEVPMEVQHRTIKFIKATYNQPFTLKQRYIFEIVLGYMQLTKKKEITIKANDTMILNNIIDFSGQKRHTKTRAYIFDTLKDISTLKIHGQYEGKDKNIHDYNISFSNIKVSKDEKEIIFIDPFFDTKSPKIKKYLYNFERSNPSFSMMDFFMIKVQQKTTDSDRPKHPHDYRYRAFSKKAVLEWYGLYKDYQDYTFLADNGIQSAYSKKKMIDNFISRTLKRIYEYSQKHGFEFPKYRYDKKSGLYKVKDYCYKNTLTQKNMIENIYEKIVTKNEIIKDYQKS